MFNYEFSNFLSFFFLFNQIIFHFFFVIVLVFLISFNFTIKRIYFSFCFFCIFFFEILFIFIYSFYSLNGVSFFSSFVVDGYFFWTLESSFLKLGVFLFLGLIFFLNSYDINSPNFLGFKEFPHIIFLLLCISAQLHYLIFFIHKIFF